MVNILKRLNSTSLDEKGLVYSLVRGRNESLKDFHKRILKAKSNLEHSKYKLEHALSNSMPLKAFDVFKISTSTQQEVIDFIINDTRVEINVEGETVYRRKLEDIKFLKHLKADLEALSIFTVEVITTEDWEYLGAKNLLQNSSLRSRLKYKTSNGFSDTLPETQIEATQDHLGYFVEDVFYDYAIANNSQYALENNVLFKNKETLENIQYEYVDFPLYITWSPIKSYSINKSTFEDILKDRVKNAEVFGIIANNPTVDNSETVEVLSQKGAKIINKILTKHNTYWGE